MLNQEKVLEKGSFRWIGENYESLFPIKTVIAGKDITSISKAISLKAYKFERFNIKNIFIAHDSFKIFYVFVNPKYKSYRYVFKKIIGDISVDFQVDHILSRNLAFHFGYNYVLLCMIPPSINSKHSRFEKIKINFDFDVPEVCYPDDRIFDKVLIRNPLARQQKELLLKGYNPNSFPPNGLTLKQKGIWNSSFGFNLVNMKSIINRTSEIYEAD